MEQFAYYPAPTELDFPPETLYLTSPRVVATCHEEVLRTALCAMPRLDTIIILDSKNFGVPWVIFATMLSTPQLRVFEIRGRIHRAFDRLAKPPYQSFAPLRAFRYVPDHIDTPVRIGPTEKRMLVILLEKVSATLETLVLPSESVPLRLMNLWEWPNLRELRLRGDSRPIHRCRTPLVSVFGRMPRLHTLSLLLAHSKKSPLGPLWPAHSECKSLPWAELKSLTLSWIHPDDLIFAHLPPTLRHLSFRAWPRLFIMYYDAHRLWAERVHWKLKAPKSAQISRILPLCPSANLERIELEYVADSAELELLRRIPDIAPRLEWLQIIRYRSAWDLSPVSVVREQISTHTIPIADSQQEGLVEPLSFLPRLRTFRFCPDYEHITLMFVWKDPNGDEDPCDPDEVAGIIARNAGPELLEVDVSEATKGVAAWYTYEIKRSTDGSRRARCTGFSMDQDREWYVEQP